MSKSDDEVHAKVSIALRTAASRNVGKKLLRKLNRSCWIVWTEKATESPGNYCQWASRSVSKEAWKHSQRVHSYQQSTGNEKLELIIPATVNSEEELYCRGNTQCDPVDCAVPNMSKLPTFTTPGFSKRSSFLPHVASHAVTGLSTIRIRRHFDSTNAFSSKIQQGITLFCNKNGNFSRICWWKWWGGHTKSQVPPTRTSFRGQRSGGRAKTTPTRA